MAPMFSAAVDSNRSAPRPAQSPTLSPDEVRDHRRVAGVVLRDARFHLADEIRADVRRLRVDAAAELREERNERRAEAVADDEERNARRPRVRTDPLGREQRHDREQPAHPKERHRDVNRPDTAHRAAPSAAPR
jgi:hypothetical protein